MILLDTPQWNSLTTAQKQLIGNIYGQDEPWKTAFSRGGRKLIESLEAKGLVNVEWHERYAMLTLREVGWQN